MEINIENYYNRKENNNDHRNYKELLFISEKILQSSEINETHSVIKDNINGLSKSFIANGEFINGGDISISRVKTGAEDIDGYELYDEEIICSSGYFFHDGNFYDIEQQTFSKNNLNIPNSNFEFGVILSFSIIGSDLDENLKDPANTIRNYQNSGAERLKLNGEWIEKTPGLDTENYFKVGEIKNGFVDGAELRNEFDLHALKTISEYDRESRGNYLISGYDIRFLDSLNNLGSFRFQVSEGKANINGYKFERNYTCEIICSELIDFELKQSEPKIFNGDGFYESSHKPIRKVFRISGEKTTNIQLTHGHYLGCIDDIPTDFSPVSRIIEITQGATTYVNGRDFTQNGDSISWELDRSDSLEPIPNSTYSIQLEYIETQEYNSFNGQNGEIKSDLSSVYLSGYNNGSVVSIDYDFILERTDIFLENSSGNFKIIKGIARESNSIPQNFNEDNYLGIYEIKLSGDKNPVIKKIAQETYKFEDISKILEDVRNNSYNISNLLLKTDILKNNEIKDFFIDTFLDSSKRDEGLESLVGYNKAISSGYDLTNGIEWVTNNCFLEDPLVNILPNKPKIFSLNSTGVSTKIFSQNDYTGFMKITELMFVKPPKASIRIIPSSYKWISKSIFERFIQEIQLNSRTIYNWGWGSKIISSKKIENRFSKTTTNINFSSERVEIPTVPLNVISNEGDFNSNEDVLLFWNNKNIGTIVADANGKIDYTFDIPNGEISGNKLISTIGVNSSVKGDINFMATPLTKTISERISLSWRWLRNENSRPWYDSDLFDDGDEDDPLSQTFKLENDIILDKIRIWFGVAPTSDTFFQIVETTAGFPDNTKVLSTLNYKSGDILGDNSFDFILDKKIKLLGNKSYAFIIGCNDPLATIQIAKLGDRSINNSKWLTSQPYNNGLLFKSSNNYTWTPIQDTDMRFEIFSTNLELEKEIDFSIVNVENSSELVLLNDFEITEESDIKYSVILLDRSPIEEYEIIPFQQLNIGEDYSGDIKIKAKLSGDGLNSPEIDIDAQLLSGEFLNQSSYTSVGFDFDKNNEKIEVYIDRTKIDDSSYTIELQTIESGVMFWRSMSLESSEVIEDNWFEDKFSFNITEDIDSDQELSRIRINLNSPMNKDKIVLKNLRLNSIRI